MAARFIQEDVLREQTEVTGAIRVETLKRWKIDAVYTIHSQVDMTFKKMSKKRLIIVLYIMFV